MSMSEAMDPSSAAAAVVYFVRLSQEISAASDAVRQSAIDAGGDRPKGVFQSIAANWMAAQGGSWSTTPAAKEAFKQARTDQAHAGSAAYVLGFSGNAYTEFLREHYGRFDSPGNDALADPRWKGLKESALRAARPSKKVSFLDEVRGWARGVRDLWRWFRGQHPAYQFGEVALWLAWSAGLALFAVDPTLSTGGKVAGGLFVGLIAAGLSVLALVVAAGALRFAADLLRPATARRTFKDLWEFLVIAAALVAGFEVLFLLLWLANVGLSSFNGQKAPPLSQSAVAGGVMGGLLGALIAGVGLFNLGSSSLDAVVNRVWPRPPGSP